MHRLVLVLVLALGVTTAEAQSPVDLENEKVELLRLHRLDREAHFKTDVDLLQERSPDEFLSVSRGKIYRSTKAEERKHFSEYFKGAKYEEWDDVEDPIVRISQDGTMAWMITRVRVRRTQETASSVEEEKFVYAGIMTYEKVQGRWMRVANVSTFDAAE